MKYFAVTGNPILHSRSPFLFAGAYPRQEKELAYFRLLATSGTEVLQMFEELGLDGMNVTAPFKHDMYRLVTRHSPEVDALEAGNTVVRAPQGLTLYNTDIYGVTGAIEEQGVQLQGTPCVVLGAGGAGAAAAYALQAKGAVVTILNRTVSKAEVCAQALGCAYAGLDALPAMLAQARVLVNTLYAEADVVQTEWLHSGLVVLDALYHGSLLKPKALAAGCVYIDGAQWLLHQGMPAYRRFTSQEPNRQGMQQAMNQNHTLPRHIAFVGFMGTGKTTVARMLAEKLGMPLVDSDHVLEKRWGQTIPDMIAAKGEAYFREKEETVMQELLQAQQPSIISCGGGVVLNERIRQALHQQSIVVWLYTNPEACVQRIDVATRPLLSSHANPLEAAKQIFAARKPYYAQAAWLVLSTHNRNAKEVTQLLYEEISKALHH